MDRKRNKKITPTQDFFYQGESKELNQEYKNSIAKDIDEPNVDFCYGALERLADRILYKNIKEFLTIKYLSQNDKDGFEEKFSKIAEILLSQTKIVKGTKEYYITDIEFYLYCNKHKDISTYPRNCDAGEWYFHASGVDISFESKIDDKNGKANIPNDDDFFGGILIRGIKLVKENKEEKSKIIEGPYKVMDELFDKFSAFEKPNDFPILINCENGQKLDVPKLRLRLLKDKDKKVLSEDSLSKLREDELFELSKNKVEKILVNYYNCDKKYFNEKYEMLAKEFSCLIKKSYRYTVAHKK